MPMEEYIQMDGEDLIGEELTNTKLVDMALEVVETSPSNLDLNANPIPNVDDQPPPIVKLSNARHHVSMLSHFLLNNSVNSSVQDVTSFKKY
jgi:acetoacetate decarboxylase